MIFLLGESKTGKNWYFRAGRKTVSKAPEETLEQPATYHDTTSTSKHVIRRIAR
jgi:hypothetical protein